MTRVIRNRSGLYFRSDGEWTTEFPLAHKFENIAHVIAAKETYQLKDVVLVLVMNREPSEYDIVLPLAGAREKGASAV